MDSHFFIFCLTGENEGKPHEQPADDDEPACAAADLSVCEPARADSGYSTSLCGRHHTTQHEAGVCVASVL